MAYQIDRYNNTILTVVEDGTIDTTTDLRFVGKNYAGYGEIQNENFLYLLENFSGANAPPRALSGQVWYDSSATKLKFFDGSKWRTTGGSEVSNTEPTGLAAGDFWWDTANEQLYVFNGSDFVLIGPQNAGEGVTQMVSTSVLDSVGNPRTIIQAVVEDEVVYIISPVEFTLNESNPILGFDRIKAGLTLKNTTLATNGITSSEHYYWGTASNSLRLGGELAENYLLKTSPVFETIVTFGDDGIQIGDSNDLRLFVEDDNKAVMANQIGTNSTIRYKTTDGTGALTEVYNLTTVGLTPATDVAYDIGTSAKKWKAIYANAFKGEADKATQLRYDATDYATGSTGASANTVAVRTANGSIAALEFQGTATSAKYADLAEKYATDQEYPVGTAIAVGGEAEVRAAGVGDFAIGVVSDQPAIKMNSEAEGQYIGLKGRVPVRVQGPVSKGQAVYAWQDGVCTTIQSNAMIGIALETNNDEGEKLVECVLKV